MALPLRPAIELLTHYALAHRDRRNIVTHFVAVPLLVLSLGVLLSRPAFSVGSLALSPAWLLFAVASVWLLTRGQPLLGLAAAAALGILTAAAQGVAAGSVGHWLVWGSGLFVAGWLAQFIGHYYEGRRSPLADDLAVGPMFLMMELLAPFGLFRALMAEVERHAGPTMLRDLAHPA